MLTIDQKAKLNVPLKDSVEYLATTALPVSNSVLGAISLASSSDIKLMGLQTFVWVR